MHVYMLMIFFMFQQPKMCVDNFLMTLDPTGNLQTLVKHNIVLAYHFPEIDTTEQ